MKNNAFHYRFHDLQAGGTTFMLYQCGGAKFLNPLLFEF